jgi:hypothetical protein
MTQLILNVNPIDFLFHQKGKNHVNPDYRSPAHPLAAWLFGPGALSARRQYHPYTARDRADLGRIKFIENNLERKSP